VSRVQVIIAACVVLVFPYISLRLGNRNELLFFVGFAATILCLRGKVRLMVLFAAAAVPLLLYLGLSRSSTLIETTGIGSLTFYLSLFGEFVFPHFPLLDHLNSHGNLWLGWSYLRLPAFFVPSLGLWDKPQSLAIVFSQQYEGIGGMGYAYTPLGEGVANFGIAAVVFVPLGLAAFARILASRLISSPLPLLLFFSIPQGINRGDFQSIALYLLCFSVIVSVLIGVLQGQTLAGVCGFPREHL
jgi:hypothetical protein